MKKNKTVMIPLDKKSKPEFYYVTRIEFEKTLEQYLLITRQLDSWIHMLKDRLEETQERLDLIESALFGKEFHSRHGIQGVIERLEKLEANNDN